MPAEIRAPQEVLDAIEKNETGGRIYHMKKPDGTNCSKGKSKAMVITRRHTCWCYYCFRCKMYGEIPFDKNTPKQTLKLMAANKARSEMNSDRKETLSLPPDFIPLDHDSGPKKARNWLWQYGIGNNMWTLYNIGWSDFYQRVIFPIEGDLKLKRFLTIKNTLLGWVARDVDFIKEEDKRLVNTPKYLIRAREGTERKFFMIDRKGSNKLVIVEDILSAIKVYEYGGNVSTLALLNSSIDCNAILKKYRGKTIRIWLDSDMRTKAVMQSVRLGQFGFTVKHVYSFKDPKDCTASTIKQLLDTESTKDIK